MSALNARINMVKQQLRTYHIVSKSVIHLMESLPRELFVPTHYQSLAYADCTIPLNPHEVMLPPKIVATALQHLQIRKKDRILEIGTGSGYITALLSLLGAQVVSIEIDPILLKMAQRNINSASYPNIKLIGGDGHMGWPNEGPYDRILVTGSYPIEVPQALKEQLNHGGKLFAFVGINPTIQARCYTRLSSDQWDEVSILETQVPALKNVEIPEPFVF